MKYEYLGMVLPFLCIVQQTGCQLDKEVENALVEGDKQTPHLISLVHRHFLNVMISMSLFVQHSSFSIHLALSFQE